MLKTSSLEVMSIGFLGFSVFVELDSCPLLDLLFSVICLSYTIGANVSGLCVVAISKNLKLTTTLDRVITQNPCYVPLNLER